MVYLVGRVPFGHGYESKRRRIPLALRLPFLVEDPPFPVHRGNGCFFVLTLPTATFSQLISVLVEAEAPWGSCIGASAGV